MDLKLTDEEYKQLVLDISKNIAPIIVGMNNSSHLASEVVAVYALHMAEEIKIAVENPDYIRRKLF